MILGGADAESDLSKPSKRRESWDGGGARVWEADLLRNELRNAAQPSSLNLSSLGECQEEQPVTKDSTFHR